MPSLRKLLQTFPATCHPRANNCIPLCICIRFWYFAQRHRKELSQTFPERCHPPGNNCIPSLYLPICIWYFLNSVTNFPNKVSSAHQQLHPSLYLPICIWYFLNSFINFPSKVSAASSDNNCIQLSIYQFVFGSFAMESLHLDTQ